MRKRSPLILIAALGCASPASERSAPERTGLRLARACGDWLESCAVRTEHGVAWPVDPARPEDLRTDLYHGSAGVVLFFVEAYRATGDERDLKFAALGADHLAATLPRGDDVVSGLYTGVAGVGFALREAYRVTRATRHRDAARRCVELVRRSAREVGAGVEWSATTDIISGGAGIGLFLLYAAREFDDPAALELATRAGRRLVELGEPAEGGRKWAMAAGASREYPNFSHGTAGVCYFLATLYAATDEREPAFLDAALDGARYLDAIARDGLVLHHEPGGEDLFYLGWCHGPPGTARLDYRLWKITGDDRYRARIERAMQALRDSGIPEHRAPGLWNNVGQCCGTAGVGELFLAEGDSADRAFVDRVSADLAARATRDADGARWVHAEHRVRPQDLGAQTGYMQGAAGIGLFLLHVDGARNGRPPAVVFPDSPFD